MKSKEEIEQLAENYATSIYGFRNETHDDYIKCKQHCIEFYTQCQEDNNDKKYTEEDIINIVNKSRETGLTAEYLILQLNKQD